MRILTPRTMRLASAAAPPGVGRGPQAPATAEWFWSWKRVADAGNGLENPNIADVDWMNGTSAIPATGLAVGSWGGGLREVTILW